MNNFNKFSENDYLNDSLMFNTNSSVRNSIQEQQLKRLELLNQQTKQTLNIISYEFNDADTGKKILNAEHKNVWFSKHVYMMFSLGKIFSRNDSSFLQSVLNYFNKENEIYLSNKYDVLNYNDDLVKRIEQNINIDNGNYHIMLVLIVYANENELKESPEYLFNSSGIVKYLIGTEDIKQVMLTLLNKYGIATETFISTKQPQYISDTRDNITLQENKFKFDSSIDWNDANNRKLYSDLRYRTDRDNDFAIRTRLNEDARINGLREHQSKKRIDNNTLYSRISNDITSTTVQSPKQGIISKMTENIIPTDYNDTSKIYSYQIYDNENMIKDDTIKNNARNKKISSDYSVLYDYGIDGKLNLKNIKT